MTGEASVAMMSAMTAKACNVCRAEKPISEFYADKSKRFGVSGTCRTCDNAACKLWRQKNAAKKKANARAYYLANSDEINRKSAAWRAADPERTKEMRKKETAKSAVANRARAKAWRIANPDRHRETKRAWAKSNPEEHKARKKLWGQRSPAKLKALQARNKARRRGCTSVNLPASDWLAIVESFDSRCAYCLKELQKPTVDHIVAVARGGEHVAGNVVPACVSCNSRKHDNPIFMMAKYAHL